MNAAGLSHRQRIDGGWAFHAQPAGSHADPATLPPRGHAPWRAAPALGTAAAMLRGLGAWSIDGPPRRFDAEDWWFATTLALPASDGGGSATLGFDGLATVAEVWIDGRPVLQSDNMFLAHQVRLVLGHEPREADLVVCCRSVDAVLARRRPRPRWRTPMAEHQQLRWLRTTLLGRLPGWTPPIAPVGPWRPVWLALPAAVEVHEVRLAPRVAGSAGHLEVQATLRLRHPAGVKDIRVEVDGPDGFWSRSAHHDPVSGALLATLQLPDVRLWWPHTHGTPARYRCTLCLGLTDGSEQRVVLGHTGFRTIELQAEDGRFGLLINGVPIFLRGACWTPPDPVSLSADGDLLRTSLRTVQGLGMNMLRIAGAMVYETPEFFALCDEMGIAVWQDFMFANMDYPTDDPEFLQSVRAEVAQTLATLRPHPSLVVLCGNSEVSQQAAMWGASRDKWEQVFFVETLNDLCRELCPGVPYWPSSAWGGSFPHQVDQGTTSYYGVGAYLRPLEDARHSGLRFATECLAFANVPEPATLERMPGGSALRVHHAEWKRRTCRDLSAGWDFEDVRDHYLQGRYGLVPAQLRYSDHGRYLTLSRIISGEVMAETFAEWRRPGSPCRGALVWFLRDLWAGAGWGLLDDQGGAKACAQILAPCLQPTTVFLTDEGSNGLYAHVVHEGPDPLDAELVAASYSPDQRKVWEVRTALSLAGRSSQTIPLMRLSEHFEDLSYAFRFGPQGHRVVGVRLSADGKALAEHTLQPGSVDATLSADVGLQANYEMDSDGTWVLRISTREFAWRVHFIDTDFPPPPAYFNLLPGVERRLRLPPGSPGTATPPKGWVTAANSRALAMITAASPPTATQPPAAS